MPAGKGNKVTSIRIVMMMLRCRVAECHGCHGVVVVEQTNQQRRQVDKDTLLTVKSFSHPKTRMRNSSSSSVCVCHKNLDHFGIKTEAWKNMAVVAQIKTEEGGSNALLALCHGESATVNAAALTFCSTFLSPNLPASAAAI